MQEEETGRRIRAFLAAYTSFRIVERDGWFYAVKKGTSGRKIAFRADMDALPMEEGVELPHASTHAGVAHKCGHDGHTAILLRLAQLIAEQGPRADRNYILIFQPEEETGTGSQKILDSGILQQYNIRAIYGLHNLPGFPLGTVVLNRHTFAAASTGVIYRLTGRATHASTPEKGLNPGLAVAEIIQQLTHLNSQPNALGEDFYQTTLICVQLGEEAFGTAAGDAEVMFTLRAYTNDAMEHLLNNANTLVGEIASRHPLALSHTLREPFRATENNSAHVEHIEEHCGCRSQYILTPFRWSEDFANYLLHFPGAMFGIGSGEHHVELHHPDYDFPDSLIQPAAQVFLHLLNAPIL